jgi:O-acetyl-ADP-ribose deacetylase (regulator of RNase III)
MNLRARLEAVQADITTLAVDAIVNAANAALLPGGGVDGAIRRNAGPELDDALYAIGRCEEGEAVITRGFRLPAPWVIHTVAPVYGTRADQDTVLARCYANALQLAEHRRLEAIAFPAIGTGAYGWPAAHAANIAFGTAADRLERTAHPARIIFCCFAPADRARYQALIDRLTD